MVQEVKKKTNRFTIRLISRNRVKKGRKPFFSLPFFILQPTKQKIPSRAKADRLTSPLKEEEASVRDIAQKQHQGAESTLDSAAEGISILYGDKIGRIIGLKNIFFCNPENIDAIA